ncbi:MAG: PQQ-binding-like beta-propeller repeat protein [Chthonomonadaceae bacterium]|nr:PQQ-binding-like beta-propeller repeat protein [Chthonomonadaceae bacterium]
MKWLRKGLFAVAVATPFVAIADFDGPAPVAWRWAQPTSASPAGSPIIDSDNVFVAVGGRIYCMDKSTGNTKWRFPLAEPLESNFRSGAVMGKGMVVAASDNRTVYAVDSSSGKLLWQHTSENSIATNPVIAGNHVVFGTLPGGAMSLDAANGQPEWKEPVKLKGAPYPNCVAWQDSVIMITNEPAVISLNPASAKLNWSVAAGSMNGSSVPAIFGDTVFLNTGYYLTAVRAQTGSKKWDVRMDEPLAFGPAAGDHGVAVVSQTGTLYTFDTQGHFMFKKGVKLGASPSSQPSFVGKLVSVGAENGSLNIIDPRSGELVFNYVVPPLFKGAMVSGSDSKETEVKYVNVAGPATTAGDTMLVLARDGSLLAFDKKVGVDLTAPNVSMIWPTAGDQVNGQPPLEVWFKIEDAASGINPASVGVKVGGTDYAGSYLKDGYLWFKISTSGPNRPLSEGRAEITVTAADWMGNKTEAKFVLNVDSTIPAIGGPPRKDSDAGSSPGGGFGKGGKGGG